MINRVLIRIKVVQMLYSYLLTKSDFKIETPPDTTGSDRRYAYMVYLDTLLFLLELAGHRVQPDAGPETVGADKVLNSSKMMSSLFGEDEIRDVILKRNSRIAALNDALKPVMLKITSSAAYRDYSKRKKPTLQDEIQFWTVVIKSIIANDEAVQKALMQNPDFTYAGLERGLQMAENTLRGYSDNRELLTDAQDSLTRSLDKAYELYHMLLLLPVQITRMRDILVDAARNKYLPTDEELNPNMKLIDNQLPDLILNSPDMEQYLKKNSVSWDEDTTLIRRLLDLILSSEIYQQYIADPVSDRKSDCEFWRKVMRDIILPSTDLAEALEAKSVFWNDDIDIMGTFVIKTIKKIASSADDKVELLPQYKDGEDARFGAELFMLVVDNFPEYSQYIERFINTNSWDPERLAFMDLVIMVTAMAEILNYPLIPIPVSLNEYIEIANSYSTPRSGQFVNGILYNVIEELRREGRLQKK